MTDSIFRRIDCGLMHSLALAIVGFALVLIAGCASAPPKEQVSREQAPAARSKAAGASQNSMLARSFEDAVTRGDAAWSAGQSDMAIYLYIQALSFQPRDVATLGKLGAIEQAKGEMTLAARAFELAAN